MLVVYEAPRPPRDSENCHQKFLAQRQFCGLGDAGPCVHEQRCRLIQEAHTWLPECFRACNVRRAALVEGPPPPHSQKCVHWITPPNRWRGADRGMQLRGPKEMIC